jgi:hypothetical protein
MYGGIVPENEAANQLKQQRELHRDIQAGIDSGPSVPASEVIGQLWKKAQQLVDGRAGAPLTFRR